MEIVKKQDYIQTPNYNGYRSLHMDIKVPVYLSDRTEYVVAEIQLRTIAMDFWASLEHDIRYKVDKTKLPEGINEEMFECAGKIAEDRPARCRICTSASRLRTLTMRTEPPQCEMHRHERAVNLIKKRRSTYHENRSYL